MNNNVFYSKPYKQYSSYPNDRGSILNNFNKKDWTSNNLENRIRVLFCDSSNYKYDNYYEKNFSFLDILDDKLFKFEKKNY